jgi:CheY-like chemotaxis protein
MHGGEVSASSAGRGRGSTFRLRLPRLAERVTTTSSAQASGAGGDKQRVIVVDDNADAAVTLASLLDLIGYEVQVANDGFAALEIGRQFRPQIGLLDIGMPGMNGYELARRIRAEAWGASVLLVAVTGWGQDADRRQALESGFDHHLTKPVDTQELQALLANLQNSGQPGRPSQPTLFRPAHPGAHVHCLRQVMVSRRNLHTTLKMLQASGICAGASVAHGKVRVWLSQPNPDLAPWVYDGTDREYAAHWLAAYVVYFYPKSDLAKVWNVFRQANATIGQAKSK